MPHAKVTVTGSFAIPNPMNLYQFYYFPNGTQTLVPNTPVDSNFEAQTDEFGKYTFSVVVFSTSSFDDSIYVTSGVVSGKATLSSEHTTI